MLEHHLFFFFKLHLIFRINKCSKFCVNSAILATQDAPKLFLINQTCYNLYKTAAHSHTSHIPTNSPKGQSHRETHAFPLMNFHENFISHNTLNYFSAEAATISLSATSYLTAFLQCYNTTSLGLVFFFPNPKIRRLTEA